MREGDIVEILVEHVPGTKIPVVEHYGGKLGIITEIRDKGLCKIGVVLRPERHRFLFNSETFKIAGSSDELGNCSSIW
jgi:hypothetical protein